jgi:hypothetical protein
MGFQEHKPRHNLRYTRVHLRRPYPRSRRPVGFPVALEKFWAVRQLEYRHGVGMSHLYVLLTS